MALAPFAVHRLLPLGPDKPIVPVGAILHVDAGNATTLYHYFNGPSGGIESHFFVRKDGVVEQYRDTGYDADANRHANAFTENGVRKGFISIETQGYGHGEWTAEQLASIKRLLTWLATTHKFPLRKCPGPYSPGVGYHTMWGAPGPWTPAAGKTCPGPDRIKQFNSVIVPWMNGEEDDVAKIKEPAWAKESIDYLMDLGVFPNGRPQLEEETVWRMLVFQARAYTRFWTRMMNWVKAHVKTALAGAATAGYALSESDIAKIVARAVNEVGKKILS